jgi:diguanylate cyclase (GGDEF)-like protein
MTATDDLIKVLLAECEKEPIHIPGSIQSFGILLTVESDNLLISNISENCFEFWNISAQDLIGHSFQELLTADDVVSLQNYIQHPNLKEQPALQIGLPGARTGLNEIWNLYAHRHHNILFLELELELDHGSDAQVADVPFRNKVIEIVQSLQRAKSLQELCDSAVQQVTTISGFDRVMLYRFDSDFNGIVVSEVTSPKVDSYLNHHFPAGDIPAQARAIFLQNWLRMIPDVGYTPSRLYPGIDTHTGESLDLSQATLRSVSPMHVEYLQNMNVKATLTISLLDEGKLWGLIACHHLTPLLVNAESRLAAQLIGQIVSSQLRVKEELEDLQYKAELKSTHAALLSFMELADDLVQGLVTYTPNLLNIANADGAAAAIYFDGEWTLIGKTPSIPQIDELVAWLSETHPKKKLFQTNSLSRLYPKANEYKEIASGVLAIAIPKSPRNYLLWFRPEVLTTVVWGGKPEKNVRINSAQAQQLHPRSSFASWAELVTGTAIPWKKVEIEAAGELRNSIIALDLERQFNKEQEARAVAETLARYDFLTNLPNRLLLSDRIAQAIEYAHRHNTSLALLFLDLDHFKHINDSLGHAVGDLLLQSAALRLSACVRSSDTVSRQGGDEFVILMTEEKQPEHATLLVDKILSALALPHTIAGNELHVTASIGISIYPADSHNAETLLKHADTAMYQAKQNGRNNYQFFQSEMNERAVERQLIEIDLRRALEHWEFVLHFQPKINLESGAITGAEALLRWKHPQWGMVMPKRFMPVAEECGLIVPIGHWVLREACVQFKTWENAGLRPGSIAVNVSALEFRRKDFVESVRTILNETGLAAEHLQLEITESVLMRDAETSVAILQQLKQMGIQLVVDNFGTGYSSLSYLTQFPIDILKIDQSFVQDIDVHGGNNVIVSAIIAMGSSLDQRVVAEGVEGSAQLNFLKDRQCEEGQGYFFSRPLIGEEYAALLTKVISPAELKL